MNSYSKLLLLCCVFWTWPNLLAHGEDWPQWMGPNRDGVYTETGLVREIPEEGLKELWRVPVANGYSGPAVAGGRVFLTDYVIQSGKSTNDPGSRDAMEGTERIQCFDAATGKQLWKHEYERPYSLSYPSGPRATPTVDGDHVYALGAEGDLICLTVDSGKVVWQKQLQETYQTKSPIWGYAAHPLIHGDLLYTLAGGEGSAVVALNKKTGEEVWRALTTKDIGYCPPIIHTIGGEQQIIIWHSEMINALSPKNGSHIWAYPLKPRYGMSIAAPQLQGNKMFVCGIGETSCMLDFGQGRVPQGTDWQGKVKKGVYSGNATALFEKDAIYGADCGSGMFIAVNPEDGSRYWESFQLTTNGERRASHGTSFLVRNGDLHWLFAETGELILAKLSPHGFDERGRTKILEPTNECFGRPVVWSHPAFAQKCVFARNDKELVCVSLEE
ncbi:MAG: PQQ-binding-like beta-propeller repeat protein [Planctomycetota bacterium]